MERNWMNRHMDVVSTVAAGVGGTATMTFKDSGVYDAMGALGDIGTFLGGVAAFGALVIAIAKFYAEDEDKS